MERISRRRRMVCADEIAAQLPLAAGRPRAGPAAGRRIMPNSISETQIIGARRWPKASMSCASPMRRAAPGNRERPARLSRRRPSWRHGLDGDARASGAPIPQALWPEAQSVIVLGLNYGPEQRSAGNPGAQGPRRDLGLCPGRRLSRCGQEEAEGAWRVTSSRTSGAEVKVFVDTAPVMEKPLAQKAGPGLAGQAHQSGEPRIRLLAVSGLDLHDPGAAAGRRRKRSLRQLPACLDVCPTDAFPAPYRLDARRCISYLTIEHKGPIPREFRAAMGNRIYGCDDCLAVCPWNKFAQRRARDEIPGARGTGGAASGRTGAAGRCRRSAPCSANRRSSASAATVSCAMC